MPPKKEAAAEPKPLIGRVGTNLKVGIVGLPNVGEAAVMFPSSFCTYVNLSYCFSFVQENPHFSTF